MVGKINKKSKDKYVRNHEYKIINIIFKNNRNSSMASE